MTPHASPTRGELDDPTSNSGFALERPRDRGDTSAPSGPMAWLGRALSGSHDWATGIAWWFRSLFATGDPADFSAEASDPAHRTPIVVLPGIWERWQYLLPLVRALRGFGHPVHLVPALGANGGPLAPAAAAVAAFLAERDLTGVVLVAHSKGGLIGKLVMLDPDAGSRVDAMVAISTPFAGSSLSWPILARSPLGIFAPRGRVILDLAAQREVNARIVSVQPRFDQVIPEGSELPGARNVTIPQAGHFRPLQDAGVHRTVHDLIHELKGVADERGGDRGGRP